MVWDKEALYAVATNLIEEIHPTLPAGLRLTIMLAAEDDDDGDQALHPRLLKNALLLFWFVHMFV